MHNNLRERLCILAAMAIVVAILSMPTCLAQDAAKVQADLDNDGYCLLEPRVYAMETDIFVRSGQTLAGAGAASTLRFSRDGGAIRATPASGSFYFASLRDFRVVGGSVIVGELSQTVTLSGIVVVNAPVDAFVIDGIGERIALRDCVAWEAGRHGFAAKTITTHNGIVLDRCSAQQCWGVGVLLEALPIAAGSTAEQLATILRDCTIQANCRADWDRDGMVDSADVSAALSSPGRGDLARVVARYGERLPAGVWIRGYVRGTRLESTWIEEPGRTCFLAEPIVGPDGTAWMPKETWIGGASFMMIGRRAALLDRCPATEIDQLGVTSPVEWIAYEPRGARRGLPAAKVRQVFPASQPAPGIVSP